MDSRSFPRENKMGSKTGIYDLSDDTLAQIFQRVGKSKRVDVTLVCKKWYEVVRLGTRALNFHFHKGGRILPKHSLVAITSRYFSLTTVTVKYTRDENPKRVEMQVDDDCMRRLAVGCVNLTNLSLAACYNITDVGIASIALCPKLTAIDLYDVSCVTEIGLLAFLRGCPSLKSLRICLLKNVRGGNWIGFISTHCHIETLVVKRCKAVKEMELARLGPRGWRNLRKFAYKGPCDRESKLRRCTFTDSEDTNICPNLGRLTLKKCLSTSKTGLLSILHHGTALRKLKVKQCPGMQDEDICVVCTKSPQIDSLTLDLKCRGDLSTPNVSNTGLFQVAKNLRGLKSLQLWFERGRFSPQISESGITAIMESCMQLEKVDLLYIPCLRARAMTAIGRLPHLRDLNLDDCEHLEDEMVFPVGPRLEYYCILDCPLLTDECLNRLRIPEGSSLELTIDGCRGITEEAALNAGAVTAWYPAD